MSEPTYPISVTGSTYAVHDLREERLGLDDLVELFTTYEVGEKDGLAVIPARFRVCPAVCRKHASGKDCGGGQMHRLSANVAEMTMLGLDLDHVTEDEFDRIVDGIEALGLRHWVWQTHSHAPPSDCRARILIPFSKPLPVSSPRAWSHEFWPRLVKYVGLGSVKFDEACRNADRIYYLPRKPSEDAERSAWFTDGAELDWERVLGSMPARVAELTVEVAPVPEDPLRPIDREDLLARLGKSDKPEVARVLKGECPGLPPGKRRAGDPSRWQAWRTAAWELALASHEWESEEALAEIVLRPAWVAGVKDDPEEHTPWETVRKLFATSRADAPAHRARIQAQRQARLESFSKFKERMGWRGDSDAELVEGESKDKADEGPVERRRLTDLGNAERFADQYGRELQHVTAWGSWLHWDGRRWRRDAEDRAMKCAMSTARSIYAEAAATMGEESVAIAKHAHGSESAARLEAMTRLARALLATDSERLDVDPMLLNVLNGTLDLRTGELRPHRKADMITKLAPVEYDADAVCPTWERFLGRIFDGKADLIQFVQRAVGYALTADVSEQVLFFLHGGGNNGKSTFLTTVQGLLGEYAKQGEPDLLLATKNEQHATGQADIKGARLLVCTEVDQGRAFAESRLKQLTGGDKLKARFMHKDFFEFIPTHKIFLAANHKPSVRGSDHAIWRRFRMVPFSVTIPDAEKDPLLGAKLRAEWAGVLAWALRGCMAWQRDGLKPPTEVLAATKEYREEEDRIGMFLEEVSEPKAGGWVSSAGLYDVYTRWCTRNGERVWSHKAFSSAMKEHGYDAEKKSGARGFSGLVLRQPAPASQLPIRSESGTK